jgi:hypothetical protein
MDKDRVTEKVDDAVKHAKEQVLGHFAAFPGCWWPSFFFSVDNCIPEESYPNQRGGPVTTNS